MKIAKEQMWQATVSSDSRYDGIFFYAVKTTGIYCRPSCRSKIPNRHNVQYFQSDVEAERAGYRPCKRCRPNEGQEGYDAASRIVEEAKLYMDLHFRDKLTLTGLAFEMGISAYHFNRIFKEKTGETPRQYIEKTRVKEARRLLSTTALSVTEIGYDAGFQSLSSFYAAFHRQELCTPTFYRGEEVR